MKSEKGTKITLLFKVVNFWDYPNVLIYVFYNVFCICMIFY